MKRLLRSCIDFGGEISPEQLVQNFQKLVQGRIEWNRPDDARVYEFLTLYFQQRLELPSVQTVTDYFDKTGDVEATERIKDIAAAPWYIRTNYSHLIQTLLEEQNRIKATVLLKEAHEILNKGLIFTEGREKVRKQGVRDALIHFQQKSHDLVLTGYTARTAGDIRLDGQAVWDGYQEAKVNKDKVWGKLTGIDKIDTISHGIKKGELWIHAAYPGELKTTLALNWCYNLVTRYKANVLYYSFEMPYEQLRLQVYVLHSSHAKWLREGYRPLDYRRVRDGQLTEEEEVFYQKVIDDFCNNPEYCQFEIRSPDRDLTLEDIQLDAELMHKQMEIGLIVLDHGQLMEARKSKRSKDYTVELNSVIRDTKKLCLHFNHGEKIPVLMLFQINRQGKEEANKTEGRYKASALSYANECVVGGTLVKTARGLLPIESVQFGDTVWSRSGWKPVLNTFDQGIRETLRVQTAHGLAITVTPNHLLRVLVDGQVQWLRADELKSGEHHLIGGFDSKEFPTDYPALPPIQFEKFEKPQGMAGTPLTVPARLTEYLAYLMGAYAGDGVAGTAYKIGFTGNRLEQNVLARLQDTFLRVFGHSITDARSPSRPGSFDLVKWSKALKRWFVEVGMDRQPGVPEAILRGPETCVVQYLRGLWDTDGSINNQNILWLSQKASHKRTLEEVQILMAGLGIETTLGQHTNTLKGQTYAGYHLRVRTQAGRARFAQVIGFTEAAKQDRLTQALRLRGMDRTLWPLGSLYLEVFDRYRQTIKFGRSTQKAASDIRAKRSNSVLAGAFRGLLEALSGIESDPQVDLLVSLYRSTRPHLVTAIIPDGPQQVYDIEVPGDHEYMTGGVLSHNCEKSADVITTTYLNDEHRRNGTTLFCNIKNRDNPIIEPFMAKVEFNCRRIYNLDGYQGADGTGMSVEDHQAVFAAMANV